MAGPRRFEVGLATEADDDELRVLLRQIAMPGEYYPLVSPRTVVLLAEGWEHYKPSNCVQRSPAWSAGRNG